MIQVKPSRGEFRELAANHRIVPVWQELLADLTTPLAAYQRIVGDQKGFLLESVEHGERWGSQSFIGRSPLATLRSYGSKVHTDVGSLGDFPLDKGMFGALEVLLPHLRTPRIPELPSLCSGFVGYLGYDIVREIEHLPARPPDHLGLPDAVLTLVGQMAAFDHWRQRVTLVDNVLIPEGATTEELDFCYDAAALRLAEFAKDGAKPLAEPLFTPPDPKEMLPRVRVSLEAEDYHRAVEVAKEHILEGDIFQVVLSERFDFNLDAEPLDVYRVLRQINPSPYMYYLSLPEAVLIGSSPEPLVQVRDGAVISRPIAGTRRRGETAADDARLAAELSEHPKERAEHVMLVDLARNDISRVIDYSTLNLDELMTLERYSHVMHMTSQVSGKLVKGRNAVDVLRAVLPAGTVSGAPKVRAMEIIDDLEPASRGPYAGAVGYIDLSGNIDAAITIRTMIVQGNRASVQAGAGIVADSVPEHEEMECRNKAQALLAAVPAARHMAQQRRERQQDSTQSG